MNQQTESIWTALLRAGIVQGSAPVAGKLESPWYVKLLLAFSGWLAALFLLGCLAMGLYFVIDSRVAAFITGIIMICGAFAILRIASNDFFEHLALALSLAGQILVVYSILGERLFGNWHYIESTNWLQVLLLETLLVVAMPNFVHRVFSTWVATFAFYLALAYTGWSFAGCGVVMFVAAWCWLNEFRFPTEMKKIQAIGFGLVLALHQIKNNELVFYNYMKSFSDVIPPQISGSPWMTEVFTGAVALYVVWQLLQHRSQRITENLSIMALLGTFLVCVVSLEVHGVTTGMVILLLGFAGANRLLIGLGIWSLLSYISYYYYLLNTTLLAKSITLFILGVVLLIVRFFMLRVLPAETEDNHV